MYNIASNNFIILSKGIGLIRNNIFILNDKLERYKKNRCEHVKFHIKSNNYFGALAAIINSIIEKESEFETKSKKQLKKIEDDLSFLQKNYKIIPRNPNNQDEKDK